MRVFGITGWKNSGKTTLTTRLVRYFRDEGYSVATIKHAHHNFDIDHPGKDSYLHRAAGAQQVIVASRQRWALVHELEEHESELSLAELLKNLSPVDLVLVEGYKYGNHPKLRVIRGPGSQRPMAQEANNIVAVAVETSQENPYGETCTTLDLNDTAGIAFFIAGETGLAQVRRDTSVLATDY